MNEGHRTQSALGVELAVAHDSGLGWGVARGARASTARLREHLEAELKSIPPEKRVVADADALVRSIWKEFADSHRTYAKGQASPCLGHATPHPLSPFPTPSQSTTPCC